ncbi:abortive infection protein [Nocardioides sp. Soil797]|nr:abortive infection protein [Nocardioides sp. Soil797]
MTDLPAQQPPQPSPTQTVPGDELGYHQLHRGGATGWWRSLLGVLLLVLIALVVVPGTLQVLTLVWVAATGSSDVTADYQRLLDLDDVTPYGLAYLNLTLAGLIPTVLLVTWWLHRLRPGWVISVVGRMRWKFFVACLGLSLIALIATLVVGSVVPSSASGGDVSTTPNPFDAKALQFLLVVLLLTPLQAAGEEFAFRGYLTQMFGGHFPTYVAIIGPAVLFALAHGAQDPPIFVDRLAFGLVAGILVVRTGGLEASIAMHVLNNWLAFGLAIAFGDMSDTLSPSSGTWWSLPVTLTQSLVYLGLALWAAKQMGLSRSTQRSVLAAPRGRV